MSKIEWTEQTWNPATGCDRVSPGCDNCYAMGMAKRLKGMGQEKYQRDGDPKTSGPGFGLSIHPEMLSAPLRWRKPRRVFVNSMSDLFHDEVPVDFIAHVFAVMSLAPQHTFQILTKRHARMRSMLSEPGFEPAVRSIARVMKYGNGTSDPRMDDQNYQTWPLPNVWLGVSVEDQKWADIRIPALLETPSAVRFLSCEPLVGPVDLVESCNLYDPVDPPGVDWVIVGGESGSGARPCDPAWVRSIVTDCRFESVPAFVKQLGSVWASANGWGGKGGLPEQWPADLRVREYPVAT